MNEKSMYGYEMNFTYLLQLLRKRGVIILICAALVCALTVPFAALFAPTMYSSSVTFYVNNSFPEDKEESISSSEMIAASELLDVYIVILKSKTTLERIIENSALDLTVKELEDMVSAMSVDGTEVFSVTVKAKSAEVAEKIADTVTAVLPARIGEIVEGSSVRLVDGATHPGEKIPAGYLTYAAIGFSVGLILSLVAVVVYDVFDGTLKSEKQLKAFGYPVFARMRARGKNSSSEYRKLADLVRMGEARIIGVTDQDVAYLLKDAIREKAEVLDARALSEEKLAFLSNEIKSDGGYGIVILHPDLLFAAKETDGVIVSVTYGKTSLNDIEELADRLTFSNIELLGFVTFDK